MRLISKKNIFLFAYLFVFLITYGQQTKRNLIANSCFEDDYENWYIVCKNSAKVSFSIEESLPISGYKSALIFVEEQSLNYCDAELKTIFPVEKDASYKISFKIKASKSTSLIVEFCENHDSLIAAGLISYPKEFVGNPITNKFRGILDIEKETKEYVFITEQINFPDWKYKLSFNFAHCEPFVSFYIDDVKISRADGGDWDGNLYTPGNFEYTKAYYGNDFIFNNTSKGQMGFSADEPISGTQSYALLGNSFDFIVHFHPNEHTENELSFKLKSNKQFNLIRNGTNEYYKNVTFVFSADNANDIFDFTFRNELKKHVFSIDRNDKYILSFYSIDPDITIDLKLDNIFVKERDLILRDFDVLNIPEHLEIGESIQLSIGEFVNPTHAPPLVLFEVENESGNASITQDGILTGISSGQVFVTVSNPEKTVIKRFNVTIGDDAPNGLNTGVAIISLIPNVVEVGQNILIHGLEKPSDITVWNCEGKCMFNHSRTNKISTTGLVSGIYFVRIDTRKTFLKKVFLVK